MVAAYCMCFGNWTTLTNKSIDTVLYNSEFQQADKDWNRILEQSVEVGAIFFDIKNTFDTVPHRPLLNKLSDLGLHPHILQW